MAEKNPHLPADLDLPITGEVEVLPPGAWENSLGPKNWYAVADDYGVRAYAGDERTANIISAALRGA